MEHEIGEKYLNKKFLAIFQDINLHSAINIAAICNSHLQFAAILSWIVQTSLSAESNTISPF